MSHQEEFFFGRDNDTFVQAVEFLSSSSKNRGFMAFLLSDLGQNLMTNNSLSIHIKSGDIFYQNYNTAKNLYNFLLEQQDDQTAFTSKKFSKQSKQY